MAEDGKKQPQVDLIVEARMASERLPGKVLLMGADRPMLEHFIERGRSIPLVDNVIIATTENAADDLIVETAERMQTKVFRGSEDDVLGRVLETAYLFSTDIIVEITGDNPLFDPGIANSVIEAFLDNESEIEYAANDLKWTYPIGFNTRVFRTETLAKVAALTGHPVDREHVVNYFVKHPDKFRTLNIEAEGIYRRDDIRLTMDTANDYLLVRTVFRALYNDNPLFTAKDIITFLGENPDISNINRDIVQRAYSYD